MRSGFDLCPSVAREVKVMPLGLQVTEFGLKGLSCCSKIWSMPSSRQVASIVGCFLSRKFLTGGSSVSGTIFLFPSLAALSAQIFLNV